MFRKSVMVFAAALTLGMVGGSGSAQAAPEPTILRIATLAPPSSPWATVFEAWRKVVRKESGGLLELQFFYNGVQGQEKEVVSKMKDRQLDGAALTATGLSEIYKDVVVFQMPGLFQSWAQLDSARDAMRPMLDAEFKSRNFRILGWGDIGQAHLMTKGFEAHHPADLQKHQCFYLAGDEVGKMFFETQKIPASSKTVPEVATANVDVLNVPALVTEQLSWQGKVDHINTQTAGFAIGALIFTTRIDTLPKEQNEMLVRTGNEAAKALNAKIRREDDLAFARRKAEYKAYDLTPAEQAEWATVFETTRNQLVTNGKINRDVYNRAVACAKSASDPKCVAAGPAPEKK